MKSVVNTTQYLQTKLQVSRKVYMGNRHAWLVLLVGTLFN